MPGAILLEDPGLVPEVLAQRKVAVLAPSRWMRSADVLPHTWAVTSDSIAAFVAGALGASRLVLIKPVPEGAVDPCFDHTVPLGLPVSILSWDRVEELVKELSG
jgi:5-(aminomethyl)-3-furanmethanol phosphate kinase